MRKFLLLCVAFTMSLGIQSQALKKAVEVTTPGTLLELLGDDAASVTDLTISGKINSTDLNAFMKTPLIEVIDMLNAEIVGSDGVATNTIPSYSMSYTSTLKKFVLPKGTTTIGNNGFYKCEKLEEVVANEGLLKINSRAFMSCYALSKFNFPSTLQSIGTSAFYKSALTEFVAPAGLTTLGDDVFYASKLTKVSLNAALATMGKGLFAGCTALQTIAVDPENKAFTVQDGVLFSADIATLYAYPQADTRTSYATPSTVTVIKSSAFDCAEKLEELRINEGVEAITNSMCYGDKGLLKLYLPSTVKTIDVGAFDACSNLAEFHIRAVTPPVAETGAFGVMFPNYKMNLYVPVGSLDAYKAAPEWDDAFLTYNEEGEQTGVEDVAASKQVASVEYYSVSGIKNAEPVDGVNIKVVRYTDGSLQTSKFVK